MHISVIDYSGPSPTSYVDIAYHSKQMGAVYTQLLRPASSSADYCVIVLVWPSERTQQLYDLMWGHTYTHIPIDELPWFEDLWRQEIDHDWLSTL